MTIASDAAARKQKKETPAYKFWLEHISDREPNPEIAGSYHRHGTARCMGFTKGGERCASRAAFGYGPIIRFSEWAALGFPIPLCSRHGGQKS